MIFFKDRCYITFTNNENYDLKKKGEKLTMEGCEPRKVLKFASFYNHPEYTRNTLATTNDTLVMP